MGFRAPAPSAIGPMHDTDTTSLPGLLIYEDDELLIDTADPSTYTVCTTAADIAAALTTERDTEER